MDGVLEPASISSSGAGDLIGDDIFNRGHFKYRLDALVDASTLFGSDTGGDFTDSNDAASGIICLMRVHASRGNRSQCHRLRYG